MTALILKIWRPYETKLTFMEILPIGLMLFASFFGAGNLIFPPALGQSAGVNFCRRRPVFVQPA